MSAMNRRSLLGLVLLGACILAYQPAWHAGFIWDDDVYITQNRLLNAPDGLRRIWFSQDSPSQYFPLVYTVFRVEYTLWGVNPSGYHWVNILLHATNALLLWRLLRWVNLPGSWLAAALFALHPVQVESVAWVTELKNLLALFFCLLSGLAWWRFIQAAHPGRAHFYLAALGCFLLALLSKTTACTLPAGLLLLLWLRRKPINSRRLLEVAPFVVLGLAMGLFTMWWERHHIGTSAAVVWLSLPERLLLAARALWFYGAKLVWPTNLMFSYPRWTINPGALEAYLWPGALMVLGVGIILLRRLTGRGPEAAALFYACTLAPTLGFIMLFTFRYTFVADHYQYAACIGPLSLGAAWLYRIVSHWRGTAPWAWPCLSGVLVAGVGMLTWHQARIYRNSETLWRDTVARNPDSWLGHSNLGRVLMQQGRFDEAMAQYREVLRTNPQDVDSLVFVGNALFGRGRQEEALDYYTRALAINPQNPEAHVNLAVILAQRGQIDAAIAHNRLALRANPKHLTAHVNLAVNLATQGRLEEALDHYRAALEINPEQPLTHINLALALTALGRTNEAGRHYQMAAHAVDEHAASLAQQGRLDEAAAQYLQALRFLPDDPEAHCGLGLVLERQGKTSEARAQFETALRFNPTHPTAAAHLRELAKPGAGTRY